MLDSILMAYAPLICLTIAAIVLIVVSLFILLRLKSLTNDIVNEEQKILATAGLIFLGFILFLLGANLLNQIIILLR